MEMFNIHCVVSSSRATTRNHVLLTIHVLQLHLRVFFFRGTLIIIHRQEDSKRRILWTMILVAKTNGLWWGDMDHTIVIAPRFIEVSQKGRMRIKR